MNIPYSTTDLIAITAAQQLTKFARVPLKTAAGSNANTQYPKTLHECEKLALEGKTAQEIVEQLS